MCGKKKQTTKSPSPVYFCVKRFFDILVSLIGIILLIPLYVIIKIAYLATGDFDKIIFCQTRIGKNGKPFKMFKFRTMTITADEDLKQLLKQPKYKKEWQKYHKIENDPRITKIGKLIRHGSIDETPQFINVLLGQISIVGPRPLVNGEIESLKGNKSRYESVKPGITGWWTVNGRSDTKVAERLSLETYYIDHQSLLLDIRIFLKTILIVITKQGAK